MAKVSPVGGCLQKRLHQWESWGQGPRPQCWEETAGAQGRERRGRDVATGLLKLVPFFLRTWTLLRLSRGKSDSLSAYLHPPQPPALSRPCQVWNHLRTPTWALYRTLGSKAGVEGPEERRWKSRSCPVLPHFVPCGRRQAGGGWGMRDEGRRATAWRGLKRPSRVDSTLPPPPPLFSSFGACLPNPIFSPLSLSPHPTPHPVVIAVQRINFELLDLVCSTPQEALPLSVSALSTDPLQDSQPYSEPGPDNASVSIQPPWPCCPFITTLSCCQIPLYLHLHTCLS